MERVDTQVGDYRVTRHLQTKGESSFYEGLHVPLRRPVLIEAVSPGSSTNLGDALLERAAQLAKLQHPALATLLDYRVADNTHYFISEHADGISLQEYMQTLQTPLPQRECLSLFNRLLDGFAYLHKQQLSHGQVHPGFIILLKEGGVKIFGMGNTNLSGEGGLRESLDAPKGWNVYKVHKPLSDEKTGMSNDVYVLGMLLERMLNGQPASASAGAANQISNAIYAIIRRATHRSPLERFPNAIAFGKALQQVTTVSPNAPENNSRPAPPPPVTVEQRPEGKLASMAEMPLLLLILAVIITAGFVMTLKHPPGASPSEKAVVPVTENDQAQGNRASGQQEEIFTADAAGEDPPLVDSSGTGLEEAEPESEDNAYMKAATREQMEGYYAALRDNDVETMMQFFNPPLQRFFNEQHVTETELRAFLSQSWRRTPEARHNIMWNTMRYGKDEKGNHLVDYWMYYHYRRANSDRWRKQIVFTRIKLNQDLKIISMTGH